jgi:hypothetical protein
VPDFYILVDDESLQHYPTEHTAKHRIPENNVEDCKQALQFTRDVRVAAGRPAPEQRRDRVSRANGFLENVHVQ